MDTKVIENLVKQGVEYSAHRVSVPNANTTTVPHYLAKTKINPDMFIPSIKTGVTESVAKARAFEFDATHGGRIPLSNEQKLKIASRVTKEKDAQQLIIKMIENETVYVDKAVEEQVMKRQFRSFQQQHPEVKAEDIFIYSPKPKGAVKSYTTSGAAFADANQISHSHIKETFDDIPENATVFMPDDCSITGASMVFDLLEKLPTNFKGRIIFAPTVKGTGKDMKQQAMADEVLKMVSSINSKGTDRTAIGKDLEILIADGKKDNISSLERLANPENYTGTIFEIAEGSLPAKSFRETETFKAMSRNEQRQVDALFTGNGLNTGYHSSGVMVLLPKKTPNNNVGIMELYGKELGLAVKPNGVITYTENIKLMNEGKRCVIAMRPESKSELGLELTDGTYRGARIPYSIKTNEPIDVVVRMKDGHLETIKYQAKAESSSNLSSSINDATERLYGFETKRSLADITTRKASYKPRTMDRKRTQHYYADVLAIPNDAELISIDGHALSDIFKA